MGDVLTKVCSKCKQEKLLTEFSKHSSCKFGVASQCKKCKVEQARNSTKTQEYQREYRRLNRDKQKQLHKTWMENNKEWVRAQQKGKLANLTEEEKLARKEYHRQYNKYNRERLTLVRKAYVEKNKDKLSEYKAKHQKENAAIYRANNAKRKAQKKKATPKWANLEDIKQIYLDADRMSKEENTKYQVDHIVPLQSDYVCGLHCEFNLQILTDKQNLEKRNYWWVDMPEYNDSDIIYLKQLKGTI